MDYELLFPGRFIKSQEFLGKAWTVTIGNVYKEKLPEKNGRQKIKGIIELEETDKEWVINRTNAECVKAMFGRDTSGWHGKRVTLYPAEYEGSTAIRVKGSPDIEKSFEVTIELPGWRNKPFTMLMEKTPEPKRSKRSSGTPAAKGRQEPAGKNRRAQRGRPAAQAPREQGPPEYEDGRFRDPEPQDDSSVPDFP